MGPEILVSHAAVVGGTCVPPILSVRREHLTEQTSFRFNLSPLGASSQGPMKKGVNPSHSENRDSYL